MKKILSVLSLLSFMLFMSGVSGCPEETGGGGGGGGGSSQVSCVPMDVSVGSGPELVFFSLSDDAYGANNFMIWEVDPTEDTEGTVVYRYMDSGNEVEDSIPAKNWEIEKTLWSAGRFAMDGLDPMKFNLEKPYVFGYLPYLPVNSWSSSLGAVNEGTCPDSNYDVSGWPKCIDRDQLDLQARNLLVKGRTYLARLVMGGSFSNASDTASMSFASHCYQAIFTY